MTGALWYSATTVDVTPRVSVPLGGYLARGEHTATGPHDPLTASLVWLGDETGERSVCWVAVDALGLDIETATRIRVGVAEQTGIDEEAVLVCSSHTHSAPAAWANQWSWQPRDPATRPGVDRLVADVTRAAGRLPATRHEVEIGWTVVPDAGVGGNRYDPAGPHDPSTGVLAVRDRWGAILALMFDYACHPTVLGHENLRYSADYPAATRRVVAAALRAAEDLVAPPVVAFLQGAAGDASTRFTRRCQTFAEADRQGGMLAGAVLRGALDTSPLDGVSPAVRAATVTVPTRALPGKAEAARQLADAERAWRAHESEPATPRARIARTRYEGAVLLTELRESGLPAKLELPVTVVALGEVAWVHLPVEPFASYADTIRAASPFRDTRVIGYTNGYFGYLADEAGHAAAVYEALSSPFDPAGGGALAAGAIDLLAAVR